MTVIQCTVQIGYNAMVGLDHLGLAGLLTSETMLKVLHLFTEDLVKVVGHFMYSSLYDVAVNTLILQCLQDQHCNILSRKSSAYLGFRVDRALARNSCIYCSIS